jgi:chromate transport protein ChrA
VIIVLNKIFRFLANTSTVLALLAFWIVSNNPGKNLDQNIFDGFALALVPIVFISAYRLTNRAVKERAAYNSLTRGEQLIVDLKRSGFWPTISRFATGFFVAICVVIVLILASGFFL